MAKRPVATQEYPIIPVGEHYLQIKEITELDKAKEYLKPGQDDKRWGWRFVSRSADPATGYAYELMVYTGRSYGDPRATLTDLLDWIRPGLTKESALEFDVDTLVDQWFEASIKHVKSNEGIMKPALSWIKPYRARQQALVQQTQSQPQSVAQQSAAPPLALAAPTQPLADAPTPPQTFAPVAPPQPRAMATAGAPLSDNPYD